MFGSLLAVVDFVAKVKEGMNGEQLVEFVVKMKEVVNGEQLVG